MTAMPATPGLHHVTAMASDPTRNLRFYTRVLGQRLVKRTVNFDDPGTHHLYYGDGVGRPGTVTTFFPWPRAVRGTVGTGEVAAVAYAAPASTLDAWHERLEAHGTPVARDERWSLPLLRFADPDGLTLEIVGVASPPDVTTWEGSAVPAGQELRGFEHVTLHLAHAGATRAILEAMGYRTRDETTEGDATRVRLETDAGGLAAGIELLERGTRVRPRLGAGSVHHVAFRAADDGVQEAAAAAARERGLQVTEVRDRRYFRSIYFREPGGVLFEIATDGPGFERDEDAASLGRALRLPPWLDARRAEIEAALPPLPADAADPVPEEDAP